jgi:hypothetical protein
MRPLGFLGADKGNDHIDEEKMRILEVIQDGTISAEEGANLLTALESSRAIEEKN